MGQVLREKKFADGCASVNDPSWPNWPRGMCENYVISRAPQGAARWLQTDVLLPILYEKFEGMCPIARDDTNAAVAPCQDFLDMLCQMCKPHVQPAEMPTEVDVNLQHQALQKVTSQESTQAHTHS